MDAEIACPYCQVKVYGLNPGDLINNVRIHFGEECSAIDPDEASRI